MRLMGSFHTMVTHGFSMTDSSATSGRSTCCGRTAARMDDRRWGRGTRRGQTPGATGSQGAAVVMGTMVTERGQDVSTRTGRIRARILSPAMSLPPLSQPSTASLPSTGLLTDHYELTMLRAALASGVADRPVAFEVFARRLPSGRRYGLLAGVQRLLEAVEGFRFNGADLDHLRAAGVIDEATCDYLATYRFSGHIDGYAEGEAYFEYSPVLTVSGAFGECVLLETVVLSILNHDSAVAAAAARMVCAAGTRPCIEMGSRRTHELSAVAASRAAYLAGFATTSNLAAGRRYGIPTTGTSAHAFTLVHGDERAAFQAQVAALGAGTTLLVDTYDVAAGIRAAVEVAGPALGAIRLDSGDLREQVRFARALLDELGASATRIVVTSDLDERMIC